MSNMIGKKFGRLTVISIHDSRSKTGHMLFDCVCTCGNTVVKEKKYLMRNKEPSCGCANTHKRSYGILDIGGMKFDKLTAIKPTEKRSQNGSVVWEFLCDCGNTYFAQAARVFKGRLKSCGCWTSEVAARTHLLSPERSAAMAMMNQMRSKNRELCEDFTIDCDTIEHIIQQPCRYCGVKHSKEHTRDSKVFGKSTVSINGIDRVDSRVGYSIGNIVTCCKICNTAKNDKSLEEFVYHIKGGETICEPIKFSESKKTLYYHGYKRSARRRNLEFYDDREFIKSFMTKPCYYCGVVSDKPTGIDRLDPDCGYTPDNTVPCCTSCNIAKLNYKIHDFYEWRTRVHNYMKNVGAFENPYVLLTAYGNISEGKLIESSKSNKTNRLASKPLDTNLPQA